MSSAAGPSIATSGLVLDIDMANTQKSWKGAPTTNLLSNTTSFVNWSKIGVTSTEDAMLSPVSGVSVSLLTVTASTNHQLYQSRITASTSQFSVYTKMLAHRAFYLAVYNNGFAVYFDLLTGTISATVGSGVSGSITYVSDGWWICNMSVPSSAVEVQIGFLDTVYTGVDGNAWSISTAIGTSGYICAPQFEVGTFRTPFVNGTRSNTQAIVDLTNNNTLTATSLTYASDNTFSFDGNSNYLQGTSSCGITGSVTLSAIIKPSYSGQTGPHSTIICTDVNYPYGAKLMNYKNTARYGLWLGFSGVDNYEAFVGTDINDNTTKMLTASWDQGTGIVNIYLNGVLQSSQSTGKTIPTVLLDGKITVGTDYNSIGSAAKNKFLGSIYYASIHNRALSAAEVYRNFNATRSRYGL